MAESIEVSDLLPASPDRVYRAWLDSVEHGAMTGGGSANAEDSVGGSFSAWDGYISGSNLELEPGRRIVQAWRTQDFPDESPDSRLEIVLEEEAGGTRITLRHTELPEGQGEDYKQGWFDHYFEPMRRYFSAQSTRGADETSAEGEGEVELVSSEERETVSLRAVPPPAEVDQNWEPEEEPRREDDLPPVEPRGKAAARPAAKKPARATAAAKKPVAKKPAAKKATTKKATAKKSAAKKATAKKAPAKAKAKAAAKKPVKSAAKKPAKKSAAKVARGKAKKPAKAAKPAGKKPAAKKKGARR